MLTRVSTASLNSHMLDAALRLQAKQAEKQEQISSGLKSDTYTGLGTDAGQALVLEISMARSQTLIDGMDTATSRAEAMYAAVGDMIDLLTSLRGMLSSASTGSGTEDELNDTAAGLLEDMAAAMNTQYQGRYLFGGTDTAEAPVDLSSLVAPTVPSTADTSYYQGGSGAQTVRLSEQQTIGYGANASDESFEQALRALNLAAIMTTDPLDDTALSEAYDLATAALDGLTAVQSGLSVAASRIKTAQASQETAKSLMSETYTDLTAADAAEATVQMAQYQTQLEASYSSLSTIMDCRLLDYIR